VIVADANVVVYLLVPGASTDDAQRVRDTDPEWLVPPLYRHELLNVLSTYVRSNRIPRDEAIKLFKRGMALVTVDNTESDPVEIFNLAQQRDCSAYDAQYIALALRHRVPLVTADRKLSEAAKDVAVPLNVFGR
jgi:predicted nucleic acid-binding protein